MNMNRRMGGFQYPPSGPPVHLLVVGQRPSSGSKRGRAAYEKAVQEVARREIQTPLEGDDLEVEMLYVSRAGIGIDIDNMVRPTLNALTGCAFHDDRQVRSIRATRFDLRHSMQLFGNMEVVAALFRGGADHRVAILIYSQREWLERWRGGPSLS